MRACDRYKTVLKIKTIEEAIDLIEQTDHLTSAASHPNGFEHMDRKQGDAFSRVRGEIKEKLLEQYSKEELINYIQDEGIE